MIINPWKGGQRTVTLTKREISTLIRLLGVLQGELEICINSNTPPIGNGGKVEMARWRRDWKQAEELVGKLERARKAAR
jgi:hypothetical protein